MKNDLLDQFEEPHSGRMGHFVTLMNKTPSSSKVIGILFFASLCTAILEYEDPNPVLIHETIPLSMGMIMIPGSLSIFAKIIFVGIDYINQNLLNGVPFVLHQLSALSCCFVASILWVSFIAFMGFFF